MKTFAEHGLKVASLYAELGLDISKFTSGIRAAISMSQSLSKDISKAIGTQPTKTVREFSSQLTQAMTGPERKKSIQELSKNMQQAFGDQIRKEIKKTETQANTSFRNMRNAVKDVSRVVTGILISQGFYTLLRNIREATNAVIEFQAAMENASVSFSLLLQDEDKAQRLIKALKEFASTTMFDYSEAEAAAKKLLTYGFEAENILYLLERLLDISAVAGGDNEMLRRIALAFGQIKSAGRLLGQEVRQLTEAGVPAIDILSEKLGIAREELAEIGRLQIPADLAIAALLEGIEERFGGATKLMEDNFKVMVSNIKDDMLFLASDVFQGTFNIIKSNVRDIRDYVQQALDAFSKRGKGGLFEFIVPPELQQTVKILFINFSMLAQAFIDLWGALKPLIVAIRDTLLRALSLVLPPLTMFFRFISLIARVVVQNVPIIKSLAGAFSLLFVIGAVNTLVVGFVGAIRSLMIAKVVATAIGFLTRAIQLLGIAIIRTPLLGVIATLITALLALAASSETASRAIDRLTSRLINLFGLDMDDFLSPVLETDMDAWDEFYNSLTGNLEELKKSWNKTAEDVKNTNDKFLAAFDEVYEVPENLDAVSDAFEGWEGIYPELPKVPDIPELVDGDEVKKSTSSIIDKINEVVRKHPIEIPIIFEYPDPPDPPFTAFAENLVAIASGVVSSVTLARKALEDFYGTTSIVNGWVANTLTELQRWETSSKHLFTGWISQTQSNIAEWRNKTQSTISGWISQTQSNIAEWYNKTQSTISGWISETKADIFDWVNSTKESISGWYSDNKTHALELASAIITNVSDWTKTTKEEVFNWAQETANTITETYSSLRTRVGGSFSNVKENISIFISETLNGIKSWKFDLGGVRDSVSNILSSMAGFWEEHKVTILTIVGLLAAGVITMFAGLPAGLGGAMAGLFTFIVTSFVDIKEAAAAELDQTKEKVETKWDNIKEELGTKLGDIKKNTSDKWQEITDVLMSKTQDAHGDLVRGWENIKQSLGNVWDGVKTIAKNKWESVVNTIKSVINTLIIKINSLIDRWNSLRFEIPKITLPNGTTFGGFSVGLPKIKPIPQLYQGGVVVADTLAQLHGTTRPEAVVPLSPESLRPFAAAITEQLMMMNRETAIVNRQVNNNSSLPPVYVGTLIADERSLKELERKLQIIRISESQRRGGLVGISN